MINKPTKKLIHKNFSVLKVNNLERINVSVWLVDLFTFFVTLIELICLLVITFTVNKPWHSEVNFLKIYMNLMPNY